MTDTMAAVKDEKPIVHSMNSASLPSPSVSFPKGMSVSIAIAVVIILLGIGSGYMLTRQSGSTVPGVQREVMQEATGEIKKGQIYGSSDEKAFRDNTEGTLEKGGLEGEGSHKLIRPGGESQTVYLTSSTLNMDQFAGKKIKIWGETYKSAKAGWFMDVGRIEILE